MNQLLIIVWLCVAHSQLWRVQPDMVDSKNRTHALCLQTVVNNQSKIPDLWECSAFGDGRDQWSLNSAGGQDFSIVNSRYGGCLAFARYEPDPRGASLKVDVNSCTISQGHWTKDIQTSQLINKYTGLCLQLAISANEHPAAGCKNAGDSHNNLGCVHLFVCDDPYDARTMWNLDMVTVAPTTPAPTPPTTPQPTTPLPTPLPTTAAPTPLPTNQPTTATPTPEPTAAPTTTRPTTATPTTSAPTTAAPTNQPTTSSPTTSSPTKQPTVSPTLNPTTISPTQNPTTSSPTVTQPTLSPSAPYMNHFSIQDNPYAIPINPRDGMNVIFVLGDFGSFLLLNSSKCCQNKVAKSMLAKKALLESQGYNVLFVAALGDNFYWTGLCPPNATQDYGPCYEQSPGLAQWQHWAQTYGNLTHIPWLGVMGNHDFGNSDVYATCPHLAPRVVIDGQAYACNALDPDKGGYRPIPESLNFHIPDFNYRHIINKLNLEVYVMDQNALYLDHIGGDSSGRTFVNKVCGSDNLLESHLTRLKDSGEQMMAYWASQGPAMTNQTRNVLLLQHYPGPCDELKALFMKSIGHVNYTVDVRCIFGHSHDTQCRDPAKPAMDKCTEILLGAGGGCCSGDPVEQGMAGFGVIYLSSKGMKLEVVTDIGSCSVCNTGQKWWTENREAMEKYWASHP